MKQYRLNIDGRELLALPGQTILEAARDNGISIPTLCYDERTAVYGGCGLCVVEVEGSPKLVKACATEITPGMVVHTNTPRVRESRKTNLELLLSNHVGDCRPPCALSCPAGTDCQGYVGLVANGRFDEALRLIKERIPLPGCIGRVCPHPCEDHCRRGLVEEPISIAWIKRFAADWDQSGEDPYLPPIAPDTGKSVAIIGGGPYGLSAAYFLRQKGHGVTIFEAMPKLGGMLRYGIPEYRLPKAVLDEEIDTIARMGVKMVPNTRVGMDITLDTLREKYDAVLLGIGAWESTGTGCTGEDLPGVLGGIDFLRQVVRNEPVVLGERVAVVGGGNTAMDACRTAVRLGAKEVYNIYRRTREEMPADAVEIDEALEEGVIFKNLTNPLEMRAGPDGRVCEVELQIMELGEPDESGRRSPKPVPGKTEILPVDTVILAIGQKVDTTDLDGLRLTRKGGILYDKATFRTNLPGVFCGGDCGNDKISIAVESIGDAQKGSAVVDAYLRGEDIPYEKPYVVERHDITEETFEDRERRCRPKMEHLSPEERRDNFSEVVAGFTPEQAIADAQRCLECGCHDYFDCKLVHYANQYQVQPDRLAGEINRIQTEDGHPFILRDPNKCILCGLCVRVCDEVMGVGALGLVRRGFDTVVKPALEGSLTSAGCISCGQCVSVCPTGALGERLSLPKSVPLKTQAVETTCSFCALGCSMKLETGAGLLVRATPDQKGPVNQGLLCARGRFGFDCAQLEGRLTAPLVRRNGQLEETDYHEAAVRTAKGLEAAAFRHGREAVAVAVSPRLTNEEAFAVKTLADSIGARLLSFDHRENGLARVLGKDRSPNTIDELLSTEVILTVGFNAWGSVLRAKLKQAAENGARIVAIAPQGMEQKAPFLYQTIEVSNDLSFLKELAKALLDQGRRVAAEGFDAFAESLAEVVPGPEARELAALYAGARKAMLLFQQNVLSVEAAALLGELAALSGHLGAPRDGILVLKARSNSQGLSDLGIQAGGEAMEGVKALLSFGENPAPQYLEGLEFLAVCDTHCSDAAQKADVVLPGTGFACALGTYTNTEGRVQAVRPAVEAPVPVTNGQVAAMLGEVCEAAPPWRNEEELAAALREKCPAFRASAPETCACGPLRFAAVPERAPLADPLPSADYLMKQMDSRLA